MKIERVSVAFGAENWERDVGALRSLLGEPTMIQDGSWAQFDCEGTRVSVGVRPDLPAAALMLKVSDVEAARDRLADAGWQTGELVPGEHELRVYATQPDGLNVIAYQPVPTRD
jgi:hypothetical protein